MESCSSVRGTVVHEQRAFVRRVIGGKEGFDAKRLPLGIFVGAGDQSDGEDGFVYRAGEQSYSEFVIPFGEGETVVADVAAELVTVIFCSGEFGEQGRPRRAAGVSRRTIGRNTEQAARMFSRRLRSLAAVFTLRRRECCRCRPGCSGSCSRRSLSPVETVAVGVYLFDLRCDLFACDLLVFRFSLIVESDLCHLLAELRR